MKEEGGRGVDEMLGEFRYENTSNKETSLLRRLQEQTLPHEASLIGRIHPFSKMAVTFKPLKGI